MNRSYKKKVAIVTITNGPYNYGNQLQNYAVLKVLDKIDVQSDTLYNIVNAKYMISLKHYIKNEIFSFFKIGDYLTARRELSFKKFTSQYIRYTKPIYDAVPKDIIEKYDYFLVGSDQVWNPELSGSVEHWRYLLLAFSPASKRISFSASTGISEMPLKYVDDFKEEVSKYVAVSVREDAGARLIKLISGRDSEVLIDPTLMLSAEEWMAIAKKPLGVDTAKKYILTYFLGEVGENTVVTIRQYEEMGYSIYNLLDKSQEELYVAGPSQFIYLIANASLILTDSFHACVFSFIFSKPFLVYAREGKENKMFSRIHTLLNTFNLERKFVEGGLKNELFESDYSKGYKQLEAERKKVIDFLKKSMNLE